MCTGEVIVYLVIEQYPPGVCIAGDIMFDI